MTIIFDGESLKVDCSWGAFALPAKGETPFEINVRTTMFAKLASANKRFKSHGEEITLTVEPELKNFATPAVGIPCKVIH